MSKIEKNCLVCNEVFYTRKGQINAGKGKTCSRSCAAKLTPKRDCRGNKNNNWKGGVSGTSSAYLKAKRSYNLRHPKKTAAHMAVRNALRSGHLKRKSCEKCGAAKAEAHHENYEVPLDVIWVCRECHRDIHYGPQIASVTRGHLPTKNRERQTNDQR